MSYLHHIFGPNRDGCKTPKIVPRAHKPICGSLTSNPRTPGLGVAPKLQKKKNQHSILVREVLPRLGSNHNHSSTTLAHLSSITAAYLVDESDNLGSTSASSYPNLNNPNLHMADPYNDRLHLSLHYIHWLSPTSTHPPGSNTTCAYLSNLEYATS